RLTKIEEISSDGSTKKEPVTFSYGGDYTGNDFFEESSYQIETTGGGAMWKLEGRNTAAISGDFSGSGKLGFLMYPQNEHQIPDRNRLSIYNTANEEIIGQRFSAPFHSATTTKVSNYPNTSRNRQSWTAVTNTTNQNNAMNAYTLDT